MRKSRVYGILAGLIVLAAVSLALVPRAEAATVSRIVDGDTLIANVDGREKTIRLLNIDTPETKHPSKKKQCLGDQATDWLAERLPPGTPIELSFDEEKEDQYGRLLAAVYEDDSLVNAEIALNGLGVPVTYGPNHKFRQEVQEAHESAKTAERGLFDPQIACTMPAKVQALDNLTEELPQVPSGTDPSAALESAIAIMEEFEVAAADLAPQSLAINGLAVYDIPSLETYYADLRTSVEKLQEKVKSRTSALQVSNDEWEAEQERLRQEQEEREAKRRAEAEKKAQQERERQQQAQRDREAQQQPPRRTAPHTPPPAPAPTEQQPTRPQTQAPAPEPQPPAPANPSPKKKSSCTPYGPEIPYSNDGGYTGPRYGMPGGKTFRKCS